MVRHVSLRVSSRLSGWFLARLSFLEKSGCARLLNHSVVWPLSEICGSISFLVFGPLPAPLMNPDTELRPEAFTIPCHSSVQPTQFTQVSPMVELCLGDTHVTIYQQESPGQPQTTHTLTHWRCSQLQNYWHPC